ncbi:DNA polymerase sigma [Plasmopara halstedii]|uniref:DNA polymerase sigma n=1 Tax=Plasmopara halstedii TaxID=4781 RepID=A0A0P1B0D9_PLAHL|nr:DNA polymerase sigma [Plasmopara halstedii]CEG47612.1 DNA polymerase sigma [Plasmopara halstedii]|eukprot:XP_024583981.1 DNA polymerase sigma [Plasmopara halstedii]
MKPRDAASVSGYHRTSSVAVAHIPRKHGNDSKRKSKGATLRLQHPEVPKALGPVGPARKQKNSKMQQNNWLQDVIEFSHQDSANLNSGIAPRKVSSKSCSVPNKSSSWGSRPMNQEKAKSTPISVKAEHAVAEALHEEILAYSSYTKKMVDKMAVHVEQMITNVRASVQSIWSHAKVETFGSYSTGIWLPSSDVDLVILNVVENNDSLLISKHLRELAKELETKAWVDSVLCLDTAKIPVLKLMTAEPSVPIDITFESAATHSGLLARDLIKRYADTMPELYPLAIVMKQLLRERDLNDAYTGGLSSYSVVLMIIHFSQLWRNGDLCFQAASIYASGSLPPEPSKMQAFKEKRLRIDLSSKNGNGKPVDTLLTESKTERPEISTVDQQKKSVSLPAPSYAAIVARQQAAVNVRCSRLSEPKLSYAAVAAGIAGVSNSSKQAKTPSSYAAAVSTPAKPKSSTANCKSEKMPKQHTSLDSISVSSSNADTEDSSSSCSRSSSVDSDDEVQIQQKPHLSLGQHLMMIFEFFGIIFDYQKNGLSVRNGGYIYRLADCHRFNVGKPALVIEDPIHPDRNVSASSFAFPKVVALFEDSYYALRYFRTSKFTPSALSCLLSTSGHLNHTISHNKVRSAPS